MSGRPDAILRAWQRFLDVVEFYCAPVAPGLVSGIGLIIVSLWFWREAARVADGMGASHPNLAIYSVRLASVAGITTAQILLLNFVVARMYRSTGFDQVLRLTAGLIIAVSLAAAVAFALLAK